jgi:glutathione S-transferase
VLHVYRIPYSTNVERVALALGHKGVEAEWVDVDPADRSAVRDVSGQDLVPVLVDGDLVLADSPRILEHLERRFPDPPLYPRDPPRRAEVEVFVDWFNRVWKAPPNAIADHLMAGGSIDDAELVQHRRDLADRLELFERLLAGRDHLFGEFGVADVIAYPFLKYAVHIEPDDDEVFHHVLYDHQPVDPARHPRVVAWLQRMAARPVA